MELRLCKNCRHYMKVNLVFRLIFGIPYKHVCYKNFKEKTNLITGKSKCKFRSCVKERRYNNRRTNIHCCKQGIWFKERKETVGPR